MGPIQVITIRDYVQGEASTLRVAESDPSAGWLQEMEQDMLGLASYERDGQLIAVTGYQEMWRGVGWAFALVDREKAAGAGRELAGAVRRVIDALAVRDGVHRVQACCNPADPATKVFLRAIGFRQESVMRRASPDGGDLLMMTMVKE